MPNNNFVSAVASLAVVGFAYTMYQKSKKNTSVLEAAKLEAARVQTARNGAKSVADLIRAGEPSVAQAGANSVATLVSNHFSSIKIAKAKQAMSGKRKLGKS